MARYRIAVPTKDCYAVACGGTEYRAKDGFVETDNPAHARAMLAETCSKSVVATATEGGKFCSYCSFHAYEFTRVCPRCKGIEWQ